MLLRLALIRGSFVKKLAVLSEVSIFLAIIAFIVVRYLLPSGVPPPRHYYKVFCHSGSTFTDELGFCGGQYLLNLVNCLISLLGHTGDDGLEVIL